MRYSKHNFGSSMRYSKCKKINACLKKLEAAGFIIGHGSKHGKVLTPSGRLFATFSITPSDKRAALNFIAEIRRKIRLIEALNDPRLVYI